MVHRVGLPDREGRALDPAIWHQRKDRVRAHILVEAFSAYVLWKTLAGWMRRAGLGDAPRTLLEFAQDQERRRRVKARSQEGEQYRTIRLRVYRSLTLRKGIAIALGLIHPEADAVSTKQRSARVGTQAHDDILDYRTGDD